MCEICLQAPCPPRCPNAEPPRVYSCDKCGTGMHAGDSDSYEDSQGNLFCSYECALEFHFIERTNWDKYDDY